MDCDDPLNKGFLSRQRSDESSSSSISINEWSDHNEESNTAPHMMAPLTSNIPTIDLPPPYFEEKTTVESTQKTSQSTSKQFHSSDPCLIAMPNLSNFHISVTDMDLDEEDEPLNVSTASKESSPVNMKRSYDKTQQYLFDDKENIAPNSLFQNVESRSSGAQSSSSFKPKTHHYRKRNSAMAVPFSTLSTNVPFQHRHKRVGSNKCPDVTTRRIQNEQQQQQQQSKHLRRSSLHRRISCDSLPDLSTLQLSSIDLMSIGIKQASPKKRAFVVGGAAPLARPNLRRHCSMTGTMGFR